MLWKGHGFLFICEFFIFEKNIYETFIFDSVYCMLDDL